MKYLTVSMLIIFFGISSARAQDRIPASSANLYKGQFKNVYGYIYKQKAMKDQELIFLSDSTLKKPLFIIINKIKSDQVSAPYQTLSHKQLLKDNKPYYVGAIGKIISFKGKPAITVHSVDNYLIYEKVD